MSKELTEQWRNGTLEENMYYVKLPEEIIIANIYQLKQLYFVNDADEIEVLAPVPDYEKVKEISQKIERLEFDNEALDNELKELATKNDTLVIENGRLQEKLRIATKALIEIQEYTKEYSLPSYTGMLCYKALKEMEGVK